MISIIIPVYNSEEYLHVCLNSILKQTYQDFEIICVEDNSSDSSLEILDFFSKKDSRIHIIKNNYHIGIGYCLNKALDVVKGEYIFFLNSKDWLSFSSLEVMVKKIEKDLTDLVLFKNNFHDEINHSFSFNLDELTDKNNEIFSFQDIEKIDLFKIGLGNYCGFYSTSFLNNVDIDFSSDDKNFLYDVLFYKTIINAKKFSVVNNNLVNIRKCFNERVEISKNMLSEEISRKYNIFKIFLENKKIYEHYKKDLFDFCINSTLKQISITEDDFDLQVSLIFQELLLKYGLLEDIKLYVDLAVLNQFKLDNLILNLKKTYPKVSVVIAIYNVENYLDACLNSVCNQTFKNIEIICINDGSTDRSKDILEHFAESDLRISIFNQKNSGLGFTRNVGMKHAKGDYILFIDSDDFIELNAIEQAYSNLISNDSDLAIFKFSRFSDEDISYTQTGFPLDDLFGDINYNMFTFTYADIKRHVLNSSFSTWSKIYKKDFLEKFDLDFQIGIAYEDVLFHVKSLLNASSISFIPKFLYNYRISNSNSIMNVKSNIWDIFEVINQVEIYLKETNYFKNFKFEFLLFKITQLAQYINIVDSDEYFVKVKTEFENLLNNDEYESNDFKKLVDDQKNIFYNVLDSKNYDEFLDCF